jgi:hypothetical protein
MPVHTHHKKPRCRRCGARIELLPYDGTGRVMAFDPITSATVEDPDARRYVMYEAVDGEDRVRLVTVDEPWDESCEHRIKQHFLSCQADPRSPAYRPAHLRQAVQ